MFLQIIKPFIAISLIFTCILYCQCNKNIQSSQSLGATQKLSYKTFNETNISKYKQVKFIDIFYKISQTN